MAKFNFPYDFSLLNAATLRDNGVKSLAELREVTEDDDSQFEELRREKYSIFIVIGFTTKSTPLKIAFALIDGTITFLDTRIASKKEIIEGFCKYCK
jgi:hypothetical protein